MFDLPAVLDQLSRWGAFIREYRLVDLGSHPVAAAVGAVAAGLLLCLWGARILRTVYILAFMSVGAGLGIQLARQVEVDVLIGLVLGAGVLALVGHLLFRLWVGVTMGLVASAAVLALGAPWIGDEAQRYADRLLELATGDRVFAAAVEAAVEAELERGPVLPSTAEERFSLYEAASQLGSFLWAERHEELWRVVFLAVIAGLLGLALGVVWPRLVMILGTSAVGAILVTGGVLTLAVRLWPAAWDWMESRPSGVPIAVGVVLVLAMLRQGLRRSALAVTPAVVPATPAKAA